MPANSQDKLEIELSVAGVKLTPEAAKIIRDIIAEAERSARISEANDLFDSLIDVWANPPEGLQHAPEDAVWGAEELIDSLEYLREQWLQKPHLQASLQKATNDNPKTIVADFTQLPGGGADIDDVIEALDKPAGENGE